MNNDFHVYFFKNDDVSNLYGIGTYTRQIIDLSFKINFRLTVVDLYSPNSCCEVINENGFETIRIPSFLRITSDKDNFRYLRNACCVLKKYISDSTTNIFHLNYLSGEYLAKLIKTIFQGRIVLTIHYTNWGIDLLGDIKWLLEASKGKQKIISSQKKKVLDKIDSDREMFRYCDKIICISNNSAQNMQTIYRIPLGVLNIVEHGVEDEYVKCNMKEIYAIRKKYALPRDKKIILYVGRISEAKGIYDLIDYFIRLSQRFQDAVLVIAGDGNFPKVIAASRFLSDSIFFLGRLDKVELYDLYLIADIGVIPSYYEEFGYVAIEMMMFKIPIVVSDVGGLHEIVDERITGYKIPLVKQDDKWMLDYYTFESKVIQLLESTEVRKELGENARKRFLEKYTSSVFVDKMRLFYDNL